MNEAAVTPSFKLTSISRSLTAGAKLDGRSAWMQEPFTLSFETGLR
jgi:hypothetical protein